MLITFVLKAKHAHKYNYRQQYVGEILCWVNDINIKVGRGGKVGGGSASLWDTGVSRRAEEMLSTGCRQLRRSGIDVGRRTNQTV